MPFPDNIILALGALSPTWFILASIAILFDVGTGFFIKGILAHDVQSSVMREGLVHKAWEVAIVICAALVDIAIAAGVGLDMQPVSTITCVFIFVMELASVCENALAGNPDLANAPVIKYVSKQKASIDPDATAQLPRTRARVPRHVAHEDGFLDIDEPEGGGWDDGPH